MRTLLVAAPAVIALTIAACGGHGVPAAGPDRESGQSSLMNKTTVGALKCDPKSADRPFVVEWDATDMSSFEAKAASDVVFVKYEGCNLKILDGCSNDSVKGALGAYLPPEWTSGSVEKVDISNEGELYAKLPLGVNSLGGRVQAGEQFHMEYYVSGTRKATRDEIYKKDIAPIARCKGATHFVYAYNLGAFALGSAKQVNASAGGTVWGIGVGGSNKSVSNAEKKGGVLTSCAGDTAKETATCKVPIRLTLREVADGENPDAIAAVAPETPDAKNLAGKVDQKLQMNDEARARYQAAMERYNARDGKGCIKELNAHDKLDPKQLSTNPSVPGLSMMRAQCVMLSGQCDAGKQQLRKAVLAMNQSGPEQADSFVDALAARFCQGGSMSPRDQLLKASADLQQGMMSKKDVSFCATAYDAVKKLSQTVKPKDDDDHQVKAALGWGKHHNAAQCLGRAGDCDTAFKAYLDGTKEMHDGQDMKQSENDQRQSFARSVTSCKAWVASKPLSPRDQLVQAMQDLSEGGNKKGDAAVCNKNAELMTKLGATVQVEATDHQATSAKNPAAVSNLLIRCLAKAGDCDTAYQKFSGSNPAFASMPEVNRRKVFEATTGACKK